MGRREKREGGRERREGGRGHDYTWNYYTIQASILTATPKPITWHILIRSPIKIMISPSQHICIPLFHSHTSTWHGMGNLWPTRYTYNDCPYKVPNQWKGATSSYPWWRPSKCSYRPACWPGPRRTSSRSGWHGSSGRYSAVWTVLWTQMTSSVCPAATLHGIGESERSVKPLRKHSYSPFDAQLWPCSQYTLTWASIAKEEVIT